ncbi:hypothetical protein Vse01_41790 [Micromonospora sediminimaris]|uniref:Uncharacterized protein n=1 Tax=Micromonospora sediminimaris TaxID=547162 RepID=A0A9W5XKZ8_9ACTN|nr:hypothetical protein Vse01_41790 [Micromonospora sediminimaris]
MAAPVDSAVATGAGDDNQAKFIHEHHRLPCAPTHERKYGSIGKPSIAVDWCDYAADVSSALSVHKRWNRQRR